MGKKTGRFFDEKLTFSRLSRHFRHPPTTVFHVLRRGTTKRVFFPFSAVSDTLPPSTRGICQFSSISLADSSGYVKRHLSSCYVLFSVFYPCIHDLSFCHSQSFYILRHFFRKKRAAQTVFSLCGLRYSVKILLVLSIIESFAISDERAP